MNKNKYDYRYGYLKFLSKNILFKYLNCKYEAFDLINIEHKSSCENIGISKSEVMSTSMKCT